MLRVAVPRRTPVPWPRAGLVAHHAADNELPNFATFAERHPGLLDKRLLALFYRSTTLASSQARTGWVEPDLAPFPWAAPSR